MKKTMFREEDHPRDRDGKFTDKDGSYSDGVNERIKWAKENGIDLPLNLDGSVDDLKLQELYDSGVSRNDDSAWQNDLTPRGQTDIPDGETKTRFVQRELGVSAARAQEYVDAIDAYADNLYAEIRAYQQGQAVENQNEIAHISNDLEEYIKRAPRWNGGETLRGMGLSDEDLQKYTVGSEHDMKGVSSWSNEPNIAEEFADHYKKLGNSVIFHSPTQNKGTGVRHLTRNEDFDEYEIIASKDSRYKVVGIEKDNNDRTHIFLEEV